MHYAIVNGKGELVSTGELVAPPKELAEKGLRAIEVDGPPDGRSWLGDKFGPRLVPGLSPVSRARIMWAAAKTDTERIEALAVALRVRD